MRLKIYRTVCSIWWNWACLKTTKKHDDAQLIRRGKCWSGYIKHSKINLKYEKNSGYQMKSSLNGDNMRWRHKQTHKKQCNVFFMDFQYNIACRWLNCKSVHIKNGCNIHSAQTFAHSHSTLRVTRVHKNLTQKPHTISHLNNRSDGVLECERVLFVWDFCIGKYIFSLFACWCSQYGYI